VLGPVTCAACGAKVREDRARCLRCGAPLRPPPPAQTRLSTTTLAIVAGALALGGVTTWFVLSPAAAPAPPAVVQTAAPPPAPGARPARTVDAARETAQARTFSSREVSRSGMAAYNRGDVAGSLEQFRAAVDADPENPEALNNVGQVLVRSGRTRDAIPYFDRAIGISDGVWAYHFNRARAYAQLQQWTSAVTGYREAARLFPDDYVTQFNLAKALEANGELTAAVDAYARAIGLAPGEPDFHLAHGQALEAAKRPAEAAAAYRRYLELVDAAPQAEKIKSRIAQLEGNARIDP